MASRWVWIMAVVALALGLRTAQGTRITNALKTLSDLAVVRGLQLTSDFEKDVA